MVNRPKTVVALIILWLVLAGLFMIWGGYSFNIVLEVPTWLDELPAELESDFELLTPILHFGYLVSTIIWLVFSAVFIIFSYGTFKKDHRVWTSGLIVSTIFLAIFSLMLASFIVNLALFKDDFSIWGLITSIMVFITDLGVIFFITRPMTKVYFELD